MHSYMCVSGRLCLDNPRHCLTTVHLLFDVCTSLTDRKFNGCCTFKLLLISKSNGDFVWTSFANEPPKHSRHD